MQMEVGQQLQYFQEQVSSLIVLSVAFINAVPADIPWETERPGDFLRYHLDIFLRFAAVQQTTEQIYLSLRQNRQLTDSQSI